MSQNAKPIEISYEAIRQDEQGNISLTALWRAAGSPNGMRPAQWRTLKRTKALAAILATESIAKDYRRPRIDIKPVIYSKPGPEGTFAHPFLAADYGTYLDPQFGVEVYRIFVKHCRDRMQHGIQAIGQVTEEVAEVAPRREPRTGQEEASRGLTGAARASGCRTPEDFILVNGRKHLGLYGGRSLAQVKEMKGLRPRDNLYDHLVSAEAAAQAFTTTQSVEALNNRKVGSPEDAASVVRQTAEGVRNFMLMTSGRAPEDYPAAPHIRRALTWMKKQEVLFSEDDPYDA